MSTNTNSGRSDVDMLASLGAARQNAARERAYNNIQRRRSPDSFKAVGFMRSGEDVIERLFTRPIDPTHLTMDEQDRIAAGGGTRIAESPEMLALAKTFMKDVLKMRIPSFVMTRYGVRLASTSIVGGPVSGLVNREGTDIPTAYSYDLRTLDGCLGLAKDVLGDQLGAHVTFNTRDDVIQIEEKNLASASMDGEDMDNEAEVRDDHLVVRHVVNRENKSRLYAPDWIQSQISDPERYELAAYVEFDVAKTLPSYLTSLEIGEKDGLLPFPLRSQGIRELLHAADVLSRFVDEYDRGEAGGAVDEAMKLFPKREIVTGERLEDTVKITPSLLRSYLASTGLDGMLAGRSREGADNDFRFWFGYQELDAKLRASDPGRIGREAYDQIKAGMKAFDGQLRFSELLHLCVPEPDVEDHLVHSRQEAEASGKADSSFYIPSKVLSSYEDRFRQICRNRIEGREMNAVYARIPNYVGRDGKVMSTVPAYDRQEFERIMGLYAGNLPPQVKAAIDEPVRRSLESCAKNMQKDEDKGLKDLMDMVAPLSREEMKVAYDEFGLDAMKRCVSKEDTNPLTRNPASCGRIDADIVKEMVAPTVRMHEAIARTKGGGRTSSLER